MLKVFLKKIPAVSLAYEFLLPKLIRCFGENGWAEVKKGNIFGQLKKSFFEKHSLALVETEYNLPRVVEDTCCNSLFSKSKPKISFIIPAYNNDKLLAFCLQSVRAQSASEWECIIVDDCSSNKSYEIALAFADHDRRYTVVRHSGPSNKTTCVNSGLSYVTSAFVCILSPHIVLYSDFIESCLHDLHSNFSNGLFVPIANETRITCSFIRSSECSSVGTDKLIDSEEIAIIPSDCLVSQRGLNERMNVASSLNRLIQNVSQTVLMNDAAFIGGIRQSLNDDECDSVALATTDGALVDCDVCFICHKDYHAWTSHLICKELPSGVVYSFVNIDYRYKDEGAYKYICENELPCIGVNEYELYDVRPKLMIVFNDWDLKVVRPLVKKAKNANVHTIGIVEGINDFDDVDTKMWREAYKTVDEVFLSGDHDRNYFSSSAELTTIGIPRVYSLLEEEISFPDQDCIIINLNFSYGVLDEFSDIWLKDVVQACSELSLPYLITQHPADRTDVSKHAVSNKDMYTTVREGSLVISRFGSIVLESLCLGKPVAYYNPGIERVEKFTEPLGAYSYAESVCELKQAILMELDRKYDTRQRSMKFLRHHCLASDIDNSSAKVAAARIVELLS